MREIFPQGDVPIVDLGASIDGGEEMLQKAAAALSFLRERGILLVAVSGGPSAARFDPLVFALGAARPSDRVVEIHEGEHGAKTLALVA